MRILFLLLGLLVLLSCKKSSERRRSDILKSKGWYPYQIRHVRTSLPDNAVLKDTTYFASSCEQESIIHFLDNKVVTRELLCIGKPTTEGTWELLNDSSLRAYINLPGDPLVGSGYSPPGEYCIGNCKLKEMDEDHFMGLTWGSDIFYSIGEGGSSVTQIKEEYFTTYKSK